MASYHILMLAGWLQFILTPSRQERHPKTEVTPYARILEYPKKYFSLNKNIKPSLGPKI